MKKILMTWWRNKTNKKILATYLLIIIALVILVNFKPSHANSDSISCSSKHAFLQQTERDYKYLSDLDYIEENNWSYNGWGGHPIQIDKNQDGGKLSLIVDDEIRNFSKGIGLHATGQVTYDVSSYTTKYPRFIAKIGVDASRGTNGSVWFQILVSNDGSSWTSLLKTDTMTGKTPAVDVDLNISGYKYLRIYLNQAINGNASDHGTIANARFVKADFNKDAVLFNRIEDLKCYDEFLSSNTVEYNIKNNYRWVLERELVRKLGFWDIQDLVEHNESMMETLNWILNSNEIIEQIIEVGEISSGVSFLNVLSDLYIANKEELKKVNGYVYQKMMIALAATYTTDAIISPLSFGFQLPKYDYLERFTLMKELFDNNKLMRVNTNVLAGEFVPNEWFKNYHVQLMRMVMQDGTVNKEDLIWLNGYTTEKQSLSFYMIPYISPNYNQDRFYAEENREQYDQKYYLSKYNLPYGLKDGVKIPRYWMVIEGGGICWNASRFAQSMNRVNGIPATGAYQPGHELYIHYYQDASGKGYWTPRYGNWGNAGSTWGGANRYRYIFNWGGKYFADQKISGSKGATSTGYIYLGQENLNIYDRYKKSLYYNLAANSYTNNSKKLETYFKSLEINDLNLDSYDYIIDLYKQMSVKNEGGTITSDDWYDLANKIIKAYTYYPVAMYDLLKVIRPYLEGIHKLDIDRLEKESLTKATQATADVTNSVDGTRTHARQLLGMTQPDPVTFSFDGENAFKLVKNPNYSLAWGYSLDGGKNFTKYVIDDSVTLTKEEIESINAENDIIINFMGLSYTFTIDITNGEIPSILYPNDLENKVIGATEILEWKYSEKDDWTSYEEEPNLIGNKEIHVRTKATGTKLPSNSTTYTFTDDNQPNSRKYVSVSHLSIENASSEATSNQGAATNAIDANYNTRWHSAWNGSDQERYITIKLDYPRYVSAVEFVPAGGGNGKIIDGTIYGSLDGQTWEILSRKTGLTYTNQANTTLQAIENTKSFDVDSLQEVQYIKIVANEATNGNWFTARAFNIFEDITNNPIPTADIIYSTTELTNKNVIAKLTNISTENYEILSEGGTTHEFSQNGEFTFRFRDTETKMEGTATARVDFIDKTPPTATIIYSSTSPTNKSIVTILKPSEEVTILNNKNFSLDNEGRVLDSLGNVLEGYKVDDSLNVIDAGGNILGNIEGTRYEFYENGSFTYEFIDKAGNKGVETARVTWIDTTIPEATLIYDVNKITNNNVTVSIDFNKEGVVVTNNNGARNYTFTENGEFTFEFSDAVGNQNTITATVDWIDRKAPTAKLKYERTKKNTVIVRVVGASEDINFQSGNGVYEFNKNGKYDIIFFDRAGNKSTLTAVVTGLKNNNKIESNNNKNNNKENGLNNEYDKNNNETSSDVIDNDKKESGSDIDNTISSSNNDGIKEENQNKSSNNSIVICLIIFIVIIVLVIMNIIYKRKNKKNDDCELI